MIFISHNYKDKPFVEHIASKISAIYGQENVFYDSWSIQPGEGIIDRMNSGLGEAKFFFFFVTKNSLESKMVTLEWQNALMKAAQGNLKFIPVKCDESFMPALLTQTLYLNLNSDGVEAVIAQMKDIIDNKSTFKPKEQDFSNLKINFKMDSDKKLDVKVFAAHFVEVISECLFVFNNNFEEKDIILIVPESPHTSAFVKDLCLDGKPGYCGFTVGLMRGITTKMPLSFNASLRNGEQLNLIASYHRQGPDEWKPIPQDITHVSVGGFPTKF